MPIYEYDCKRCGKPFEKLVKTMSESSAKEKAECPSCGSKETSRKLSAFAAVADSKPQQSGGGCRCGGPGPCGMS